MSEYSLAVASFIQTWRTTPLSRANSVASRRCQSLSDINSDVTTPPPSVIDRPTAQRRHTHRQGRRYFGRYALPSSSPSSPPPSTLSSSLATGGAVNIAAFSPPVTRFSRVFRVITLHGTTTRLVSSRIAETRRCLSILPDDTVNTIVDSLPSFECLPNYFKRACACACHEDVRVFIRTTESTTRQSVADHFPITVVSRLLEMR